MATTGGPESAERGLLGRFAATWLGSWWARLRVVVTVAMTVGVVAALSLALGAFDRRAVVLGVVVGLVVSAVPPERRR